MRESNAMTKKTNKPQGAQAVKNGKAFEEKCRDFIQSIGYARPRKYSYEAYWHNKKKNQADAYVEELNLVNEFKYQNTSGTADQKIVTELMNAAVNIKVDTYAYVYDGPETKTKRWRGLVQAGKDFINLVESQSKPLGGAKKLMIMSYDEFCAWMINKTLDIDTRP